MNPAFRVVVLISGRGSNLQAIINQIESGRLPAQICCVISNRADAEGLVAAQNADILTQVIEHKDFSSRNEFEQALIAAIDRHRPDLVVLAGFMRVLSPDFVRHYHERLINIHPSLLPRFPGLNTHTRAIEAGDREHGATVHFVTPEVDSGPVIIQARVPVHAGDTPDILAARVLEKEHEIYPRAIGWIAENRVTIEDGLALLDGHIDPSQGIDPEKT